MSQDVTNYAVLTPPKLAEATQTADPILDEFRTLWNSLEMDKIIVEGAIGKLRKHKTGAYRRAAAFLDDEIERSAGRYARLLLPFTLANILKTIRTNDAIEVYNATIEVAMKDVRSLKDRKMLIEAFAKILNSPEQVICLKCGKLYLRSDEVRGYCSKRCWKGILNRNDWLRRSGRSNL